MLFCFILQTYSYRITTKSFEIRLVEETNAFRMSDDKTAANKKSFSPDWLVRGVLTKLGDIFDRFTGRRWKPSSSLATSELIDRLNQLLDREAKDSGEKGVYVPHNIKLKMQWDKFSIDSEEALKKLEYELLIAAIDHINDNRYHTYAPLKLEVKPDYFTEGVKLLVSFDNFAEEESEAALNVTVPNLKNIVIAPPEEVIIEPDKEVFIAEFVVKDKPRRVEFTLVQGQRLSVGRTRENALDIEDGSVSKIHASLVLNRENQLMVADTGSTNGTFINDQRIAYGKAFPIGDGDKVKFGIIEVSLQRVPKEVEQQQEIEQEEVSQTAILSAPKESTAESEDSAVIEDISDEEPILDKENFATKTGYSLDTNSREENHQPTEQKIALDFGEEK